MITYNVATEDFTTGERAGAAIFRYSARIQSIIKAKVPAEPFMHICFIKLRSGKCLWGVYVWDNRQVLETGETTYEVFDDQVYKVARYASDNHKYVKGQGEFVKHCNDMFGANENKAKEKAEQTRLRLAERAKQVPKTYSKFKLND
jgi:hypothetical protein